jgi:S1-C subfamily serine protease
MKCLLSPAALVGVLTTSSFQRSALAALVLSSLAANTVLAGEPSPTATSYFNERWLDAVVSIESGDTPVGTGFLVAGCPDRTLLVTAAHVVRNENKELVPKLGYRRSDLAASDSRVSEEDTLKANVGGWYFSDTSDLAARVFAWRKSSGPPPVVDTAQFIEPELLNIGAPVLVLGFPLGLRSSTHNQPVARHGIVAGRGKEGLLIEAFVFPGNSGGPVVYVPQIKVGVGISSGVLNEERLVGVVSSYIPYQEPAISLQTHRPRIVFEENSGIANVVPISALQKLIETAKICPRPRAK